MYSYIHIWLGASRSMTENVQRTVLKALEKHGILKEVRYFDRYLYILDTAESEYNLIC